MSRIKQTLPYRMQTIETVTRLVSVQKFAKFEIVKTLTKTRRNSKKFLNMPDHDRRSKHVSLKNSVYPSKYMKTLHG